MPVDTNFSRHLLRGRKRAIAVEWLTHVRLRSVISVRRYSSTIFLLDCLVLRNIKTVASLDCQWRRK